jgi:hypothetical protein
MKKRIRLTESGLTNLVNKIINEDSSMMKDKLLGAAEGMSEAEKGGWVKLIKECIAEFDEENPDFSRDIKVEAVLSGLMLLFILGAILLDFDIAAVLGVGGLVMLGDEQIKKWKKVIECAKNKKNNTIEESIMKKTIRLTESELINLVQRIIKEEEMGSNKGFTIAELYKKSKYTAPLPNRLVISSFKGTSIKVDGVDKTSGSINPTSKISCQGNCEIEFKDVQDFGQMTITIKGGVPKLFVTTE